jgi:RNA polymerase sigma-70 factor (ECF subfamily)
MPVGPNNLPFVKVVRLAQRGDAAAFERLYLLYSGRVHRLCRRMVKNGTEAEDLTQEVFMQLLCKIQTFRGESAFSTWLHRLAVNVVLRRFRKKSIRTMSFDTNEANHEDKPSKQFGGPDPRLTASIDRVNLERAFNQLPRGCRAAFFLHDVMGYEHHEIAAMRGCSVGASKSQLYKGRMRLRVLVRGKWRSKLWILVLALLCLRPAGALAQSGGSAAASGQMKIAILNVRQAIVATTEGKEASAKFQSKFAAQQNDLQNMQKQIQELQDRLSNNQGTLAVEQARLQRQGELLTRQFQRKQDELNEEETAAQSDVAENIGRQMLNLVDRYSREHGYAIVLDVSAQGTPVVYSSSQDYGGWQGTWRSRPQAGHET